MNIPGTHEWTPREIGEKTDAVAGLMFSETDHVFDDSHLAETSYETAAVNQILAWLDFPYQQRAYLDCLIALAAGCGKSLFTATNIEIARQLRTGKNSQDESLAKWVTRQKKKYLAWQAGKQFNLVEITDGSFDPVKQKNTPATYRLHLAEWAQKAVALAKSRNKTIWRANPAYRRFQLRAIRRAAFDLLQSIPECPPLKLKIRTLSVEDNFDRRAHSIFSFAEMNKEDLHRAGFVSDEFIDYLITGLEKIKNKPAGLVGNLITPEKEEVNKKAKVWRAIMRGHLGDLISSEASQPLTTPADQIAFPQSDRTDMRTDTASDNCNNTSSTPSNSLIPLTHGRTFCDSETVFEGKDLAQKTVDEWFELVREKYPPPDLDARNHGAWEIIWESVTSDARRSSEQLQETIAQTDMNDAEAIEQLRRKTLDYIISRIKFWKGNIPMQSSRMKIDLFRDEIDELLTAMDPLAAAF